MTRTLTLRVLRILFVAIRHGYGCVASREVSGPERLRMAFEELGGSFLKFGQMLALQPDILSIEYCNALFNLLDRVPPFPYEAVEHNFREELGQTPDEIFDTFERIPIAAASIGQVHVATLNGQKLAVKVQRPTVDRDFAGDIRLMSAAIHMIKTLRLRPLSWMIEPMSEFISWTRDELDYRQEARYMEQLRRNARANPCEHVPVVLEEFTTRRTLVMEFLEGHTVLAYLRALEKGDTTLIESVEAGGFDSHQVASRIIDNFLGDVFRHGLFHADLHPANLMILPGNVIGYIDFGITGVISSYSRENLVALTLAYTRGDLAGMCEAFFRVSVIDSHSSIAGFQEGLARDAKSWYQGEGRERHLRKNFTLVMLDMLRLSRSTGIWPERDVIKYIRSAIAIDGLITRFAPTFDLGHHLEIVCCGFLNSHARKRLFSLHSLIGWTEAAVRLFQNGGPRVISVLKGSADTRSERLRQMRRNQSRLPLLALYYAGFVFVTCFAAALSPEPVLGRMNLFTAESALATAGLMLLLRTIRRFSRGG